LSAEREVSNIRKASKLAKSRMTEIRSRTDIGRSRKVDLLAAQAQLAVLESQLAAGEGTLSTVRDQFALSTGLSRTAELSDAVAQPHKPGKVEAHLARLDQRPDIAALRAQVEQAREGSRAAWSGHLPTLSVGGNYYITREGPQRGNLWDVALTFTLPLFAGGGPSARVREANERAKELELSLAQTRRNAEIEIRTLHGNLASMAAQLEQLERALKLTEESFKEQEKNYRFGQVTNLDVIQALTLDLDTRRTLDRTRYQALSGWASLQAATAQIP
jgi:outer membrane protein TolC